MKKAALWLAVASLAAGCASGTSTPTSPSATDGSSALNASQVAGTWTLSSLQPAGQTAQPVPGGATYNLTLTDGRASAKADCNVCNGGLTVSGSTLSIGPALACTRAACVTMDYETKYESMLSGDSSAAIDGTTLTLSSARGVLRFTR